MDWLDTAVDVITLIGFVAALMTGLWHTDLWRLAVRESGFGRWVKKLLYTRRSFYATSDGELVRPAKQDREIWGIDVREKRKIEKEQRDLEDE